MKGTRKAAETKPEHERIVSLLPSEMTDPRRGPRQRRTGLLADLIAYDAADDDTRKARKLSNCPADVDDALSVVRRLTDGKQSREAIAEYLIGYGVGLLTRLDGVREIDDAREILEAAGDTRRADALRWTFRVPCTTEPRSIWPRLAEPTWSGCAQLAKAIGIPVSQLAALALMAGLISLPIADHVRVLMLEQLRAFRDRVREQADEATLKAKRAEPATVAEQLDFARDVLEQKPRKNTDLEPRKTTNQTAG